MKPQFFYRSTIQFIAAILIATLALASLPAPIARAASDTYTTAGTFSWTAPAGVTSVTVEVWGGGGRGGSISSGSDEEEGGGGGGGGYSIITGIAVTPGAGYDVVVGAGSNSNSPGGDSYFIDSSTILARGGNSATDNNGAAGGAADSGVGTTKYSGGEGADGNSYYNWGGGGGSSAGTDANGTNATIASGAIAPTGGGDGGDGRWSCSSGKGSAGTAPGGGGGGAYRSSGSSSSYSGGKGAPGKVVITLVISTTVGDGTAPASKSVKGSDIYKAVSAFTLATSTGADTVTGLVVTGSGTGLANVAANGVKLWLDGGSIPNEWDAGDTAVGSGVSFSGSAATFSGLSIPVTTTATQYLITYEIIDSPTNAQTMLAAVTGVTATNTVVNNDTTDATLTVDTVAPTVTINQAATQVDPTSTSPILFTAVFSEAVTGFTGADISFTGSTATGTKSATVSGTGPTYTVSVSGMTSSGTVVVSIPPGAVVDLADNANLASTSTDRSVTYSTGAIFADVPITYWAWSEIERLYAAGFTTGCSLNPFSYCPERAVTRAEMAVFIERGIHGAAYIPPSGSGGVFADVPLSYWDTDWIEKLYADHITSGCSSSPLLYCPDRSITRAEMAVFLLKAKHGAAYTPPAAVGIFTDVPTTYWAASWIEQLYAEKLTGGCNLSPLSYCPDRSVTRAEMAVFLVRTFNLP